METWSRSKAPLDNQEEDDTKKSFVLPGGNSNDTARALLKQ